jgi:hypothetical protein
LKLFKLKLRGDSTHFAEYVNSIIRSYYPEYYPERANLPLTTLFFFDIHPSND